MKQRQRPKVGDRIVADLAYLGREITGEVTELLSSQFLIKDDEGRTWFVMDKDNWRKANGRTASAV